MRDNKQEKRGRKRGWEKEKIDERAQYDCHSIISLLPGKGTFQDSTVSDHYTNNNEFCSDSLREITRGKREGEREKERERRGREKEKIDS